MVSGVGEAMEQPAIVREQQQAGGVLVQATDGLQCGPTDAKAGRKEVKDGRTASAPRGFHPAWFVKDHDAICFMMASLHPSRTFISLQK